MVDETIFQRPRISAGQGSSVSIPHPGNCKKNDEPVAVANIRCNIRPNSMAWLSKIIEAPGATLDRGRDRSGTRHELDSPVFTCSIESNIAMKKVFAKVGMYLIHTMHQLKFSELQKHPGWTAANHNEDKDDDDDADCKVQPLLKHLEWKIAQKPRNKSGAMYNPPRNWSKLW
jgi:hypothetical protein